MADALPPATSGLAIPCSAEESAEWHARLDASVKAADAKKDEWKPFVSSYMVRASTRAASGDHSVQVPLIYAYTELKKSQLRFQVPEVNLKPKRPEWAAAVFERDAGYLLVEDGVRAHAALAQQCGAELVGCCAGERQRLL